MAEELKQYEVCLITPPNLSVLLIEASSVELEIDNVLFLVDEQVVAIVPCRHVMSVVCSSNHIKDTQNA